MADVGEERPRPARWWLPENNEERVAGLYWIDDHGAARITVHERLADGLDCFGPTPSRSYTGMCLVTQ